MATTASRIKTPVFFKRLYSSSQYEVRWEGSCSLAFPSSLQRFVLSSNHLHSIGMKRTKQNCHFNQKDVGLTATSIGTFVLQCDFFLFFSEV